MRVILTTIAAVLLLAGCSSNDDGPTPGAVNQPSTTASSAPPATPTAAPEMIIEGKAYPLAYGTCAQGLWDKRVGEWNQLVQVRDAKGADAVVVNGKSYDDQAAYFKAKAWPATLAATLESAATKKACGNAG